MSDAPDTIYLQVCGDCPPGCNHSYTEALTEGGDVTWCVDRMWDSDVEYRRVDPATKYCMHPRAALVTERFIGGVKEVLTSLHWSRQYTGPDHDIIRFPHCPDCGAKLDHTL